MQALPYRTSDLRPGQVVGSDVFDVRTGMVIIRAGFELTEPVITGLARHDIRCVFVAQGPLEKEVWRATREELAVEQSARSIPQLAEVCGHLYSNYASAGMHGRSPEEIRQVWSRLHQTVADLIREIREKGVDLAVLLRAGQEGTDLYLRSATVTYLSVLTALHLFPGEEHAARSAALAALFHDAALANEEFISGRRPLEEHPLASAELLKQIGFNDPVAAMIVRGHHRNIDGSGYPRRQAEDGRLDRNMHHLAGIVRLAVAYCEATAGCGREQLLLPIEALGSLKAMNERFQAKVFGHAELSEYLMKLSASADPAEQHLC
jgi:response regulator RpfG family c-di-GMP phosphodiesterase